MKEVKVVCSKCGNIMTYKNWFSWILHTPFHWFSKRRAKCTNCGEYSYMGRIRLYYRIRNFFVYGWDNLRRRCQRFKRGYAWSDVWDMDVWFMNTAKPMLTHLRDYGIGIPGALWNEEDDNRKQWEDILTEMINCLDLMCEDNAEKYLGIDQKDYSHESYKRIRDCMDKNKNRFFELFSEYFYNLWD